MKTQKTQKRQGRESDDAVDLSLCLLSPSKPEVQAQRRVRGSFFLCRLNLLLPIFCSAAFITLLLSHSLCYLYVSLPTLYVHSFFPSSLFFSSHVSYASDAPTHCCSSEVEVQAPGCQPKHLLRDSMNSPGRPSRQSKRSPKKGLPATTDEPALS